VKKFIYAILLSLISGCVLFKSKTFVSGIGISVLYDSTAQFPYIVEIISGSPAAMSGLRSGDYLIKVDGKDLQQESAEFTLSLLAGLPGTVAEVNLMRGNKIYSRQISRDRIRIPTRMDDYCNQLQILISNNPINKALLLPGFEFSTFSEDSILNTFYRCTDTIQARRQFEKLVSITSGCLSYTDPDNFKQKHFYPNGNEEFILFTVASNEVQNTRSEKELAKIVFRKDRPLITLKTKIKASK
jgi:hypothetical protein